MNPDALCWLDQQILPAAEAKISVFDHGLLYGDGIFEGLRFYQRRVFRLAQHLQRLQHSANALALQLPMSMQQISAAIAQLIERYPHTEGYLRLVVTRGSGSLGIDPQKCARPSLFIIADELSVVNHHPAGSGIRLLIASTRRTPAECLSPRIKSLNYLKGTSKNCLFPRLRRQCRARILMYPLIHCGSPRATSLHSRKNPIF